jgi:hypothetical protein
MVIVMRKFFCLLCAAVMAAMILPVSVFAEDTAPENATFCFDTDSSLSSWSNFSGKPEAQIKAGISDKIGEKGYSMALSTNRTTDSDSNLCGIYFTAASVGLESFDSCKIQFSYYIPKEFADYTDKLSFYSDGIVWIQNDVDASKAERWLTCTVDVPKNATNSRVGVFVPAAGKYSGKIAYIDNVIVYGADGNPVANVGDYKDVKILGNNTILQTDNPIISIIEIAIIVIIIIGIIILISRIMKKRKEMFR